MRRLLALITLLIASLFVAQSTLAATAAYPTCCLEGCEGKAHCLQARCAAANEVPLAAHTAPTVPASCTGAQDIPDHQVAPASPVQDIWHPPD